VDLENEKVAGNQSDTAKLLKIDCKEANFSTVTNTAATAVSTQAKGTGVPFKTPLLVTFVAKPNHVNHTLFLDGWQLDMSEPITCDGSHMTQTKEDALSHPTNDTQVSLGWIKFKGTTEQERHYNWTGNSDDGPVFKQVRDVL
jgi:hypothetical protein